jgi:hypothetical protein
MLYIYMLGYDVDFGHMETVSLISAPKYPEKQVKRAVLISLVIVFFLKCILQFCVVFINCYPLTHGAGWVYRDILLT